MRRRIGRPPPGAHSRVSSRLERRRRSGGDGGPPRGRRAARRSSAFPGSVSGGDRAAGVRVTRGIGRPRSGQALSGAPLERLEVIQFEPFAGVPDATRVTTSSLLRSRVC